MRLFFNFAFAVSAFALPYSTAWAKQVEVQCTPKAYSCYNSPEGYVCRWNNLSGGAPALAQAFRDPNYPKEGANFELYRAHYQTSIDRHALTLSMEFKVFADNSNAPHMIRATLDAGSVIAEASGLEQVDISLRNNNYGRGYYCSSFRVLE